MHRSQEMYANVSDATVIYCSFSDFANYASKSVIGICEMKGYYNSLIVGPGY